MTLAIDPLTAWFIAAAVLALSLVLLIRGLDKRSLP